MEEINKKNIKAKPNIQYSTNEFLQDLNKLSLNEKVSQKFQNGKTIKENNQEIRNKINSKLNFLGEVPNTYYNEVMAAELKNLSRENSELKFCLDKLNKKFDKEIKELKNQNMNKIKEINSSKEIMKKNVTLIELLGKKISQYEKIFKDIENKKKEKNILDKNINQKLGEIEKENEQLLLQIEKRDNIIKNFKEEMDSKKEIFGEINKMKKEMETNLNTMDNLYKEIQKKDETINKLKKLMELMRTEHEQEIDQIKKENKNNNSNKNSSPSEINNEDLIKELEKSKEKQKALEEELKEIKKNYNTATEYNNKMQELTKEASQMIKNSLDSREQMKQKYDEAIKELIEKYEKQIQFMKVIIVEQNEKYEKKLEEMQKEANKDTNNDNKKEENINTNKENEKEEEEKNKYLEKLKNDNIILLNQNSELKKMNEMLLTKMKDLPELNKRFNELFETVKLLKEENDLLKKSMKDSKIMKMLELEQEKEEEKEEEEINEKEKEEKEENKDEKEEQKFSEEELQVLESILKDIENGKDIRGENDINKLEILENILKKLGNKNEEQEENDDDYNEDNKNEEEKNNEKNINNDNNEDIPDNKYTNLLLQAMMNSLEDNKEKIPNVSQNEKDNLSNNQIYNKKVLKSSPPGSIKKKTDNNETQNDKIKIDKLNIVKKNLNIDNEEKQEKEDEEEKQNKINENYNLYKPTYEGMLSFNLSKKLYSLITPKKYEEFLKVFDPKTSIQYNTLEGLFVIPSNKSNQLFYYSFLKNTMSELFNLKENHSGGCLFLDNTSKNIIAIGGDNSKKVEKFSFEDGKLEELPELPDFISKMTCIQIGNKIYSFFGIAKEGKENDKSPILCLDLDNMDKKWEYIKYEKEADFNILSGMSCTNLNDNELLIIGGIFDDEIPNDKLMYFNLENKKLLKLDKSLPESENKKFVFTENTQFNIFINGDIILYANIDNNNQIHIIDNELHYDLYLTPSEI